MNLFIVEDEDVLLEKYQRYLEPLFESIDVAYDYNTALKKVKSQSYQVYLLDYNLPDGNGLDLLSFFQNPKDAVIAMITGYSKEKVAIRSLNLGVFRYIEKPISKESLIEVIKDCFNEAERRSSLKTLEDQFSINEHAQDRLTKEYFLTNREIDVLKSTLVLGKNKSVGDELNLSQGTVRNHLSSIYQKLHVENKEELRKKVKKLNS